MKKNNFGAQYNRDPSYSIFLKLRSPNPKLRLNLVGLAHRVYACPIVKRKKKWNRDDNQTCRCEQHVENYGFMDFMMYLNIKVSNFTANN